MSAGPRKKDVSSSPVNHPPTIARDADPGAELLSAGQPDRVVTVLAVSPFDEDHIFLSHLFSHSNWKSHQARSCGEALAVLHHCPIAVVLCESELPDWSWKDMLAELDQLPETPLLIVTSRLANDQLWAEVLNLGGYDVLMKPFDRLEVLRVISLAWLHWKEQRERSRAPEPVTRTAVG